MPETAGQVQLTETKMAFYAGGVALMTLIRGLDKENPGPGFKAIEDELLIFAESTRTYNVTSH